VHLAAIDTHQLALHGIETAVASFGDVLIEESGPSKQKHNDDEAAKYASRPRLSRSGGGFRIFHEHERVRGTVTAHFAGILHDGRYRDAHDR